ncbi:MAG: helix-turn-helix domain-containing protein [Verrucomicrobia bacterium]|nr:helix-turn-helix domain-containing protein [Verrucomicrobiota bacterium]
MTPERPLQPTLWRTCRAIANRARLRIFRLLVQQPGQTVSAVAAQLQQPLSAASEYLRALEARGLLTARRVGRRVEYRPTAAPSGSPAHGLVVAMQSALQSESQTTETLFRLATAFTHPRRIEIFRALKTQPQTLGEIQTATRISARALKRHLRKLEARGFVKCELGIYSVARCSDVFGRELARLAAE